MTLIPAFYARQIPSAQLMNQLVDAINAVAVLGAMTYQGSWNANANSPALASGIGIKGFYYTVSVAGTTAIDGISSWNVGDKIAFNGTVWEKFDGVPTEVMSVAGLIGVITAGALKTALAILAADISDSGVTGRALLQAASAAAAKTALSIAAADISDASANGRSLIQAASYAAMRALLAITAADITDASVNGRSLIQAANYAAMLSLLGAQAALGYTPVNKAGDTMAGPLTLSGDPASNLHAATKQYVDNLALGLDAKASCRAATTANITLSGTQTIDGVAVVADNRVLVKNQSAAAENGIYLCKSGAWVRTIDMDAWAKVPGALTQIEEGTANADTMYICTANQGGTLGSTAIAWAQLTSSLSGVASFNSRTGAVTLQGSDLTAVVLAAGAFGPFTDLASAATCDLGSVAVLAVNITGTTTITSLGTGANLLRFVKFAAALILTHNAASLILPGAANITTAAGDTALFLSDASGNWRCLSYLRAAGRPLNSGVSDTIAVGFKVAPYSIGTVSSGTTTPDPASGNYQYYTNNGAHTLAAPSSDCAIDVLVTNGASAGAITFSGFTVGASTGSALTTTNGDKFLVSIRRVNGVSTYSIYALQ